jgi:heat shock protein HslJ
VHLVRRAPIVVLIGVLVAACGPTASPAPSFRLEGSLWKLVSVGGQPVPADGQGAAGLEIGTSDVANDVRGSGPCGELLGSYHQAGSSITFTVASTKVNECDAATLQLRAAYLDGLAGATTWKRDATSLTISGKTELVFENVANHL